MAFVSICLHPVSLRMVVVVMGGEIHRFFEFESTPLLTPFLFADEPLMFNVMTALVVIFLQMMLYVHNDGGLVFSWKCFCTMTAPYQSDFPAAVTGSSALHVHRGGGFWARSLPEPVLDEILNLKPSATTGQPT